jgi:DNA polymerase (family 10)
MKKSTAKRPESSGAADRFTIAQKLQEIGDLLQLSPGTERFKARAYQRGAKTLLQFTGDLDSMIRRNRLTEIGGIGPGLSAQITEIARTGNSTLLEKLRARYPPGILELSRVPSLNLKKIELLHREIGVDSIAALKDAAEAGRIRGLKGFGEKTEQKLLQSLAELKQRGGGSILLFNALRVASALKAYLTQHETLREVELARSFRRFHETATQISLVASATRPGDLVEYFLAYPLVAETVEQVETRATVRLSDETMVSLFVVEPAHYATALLYETGSERHVEQLEALATERGLILSRNGLHRQGAKKVGSISSEAKLYRNLGMSYVPPELREGEGEVEAAIEGDIAKDLVKEEDIRGLVHCHTVYSDGRHTVKEMALAADARGAQYLTITDHSPSAFYAGGVKIDRLMALWDEIDSVQESVSVKLLKGTESDILADGSLDYPDHILEQFDIIIASIHARMKMDEQQMTRRVLGAVRQPLYKIWGHPLGRLLNRRPPFACRMEEILDAIAESGQTAIEVNGDPYRLDLEPRWIKEARKRGIRFVISTDAHSTAALANVTLGVGMARRGWVTRSEVLNTLPTDDFKSAVRPT